VLFGEFDHGLDDKGRITIPAVLRDELGGQVFVTRGPKRQLLVFPQATWEQLVPRVRREPLSGDIPRVLFSGSLVPLDSHGRVLVPPALRSWSGLEPNGQAVVVGVVDHLEFWAPTRWEQLMDAVIAEDQLTQELKKLGL
jgi:MraZ protein